MSKIAFIGLGIMGSRMAAHLAKNNVSLIVYNRDKSKTEELKALGTKVADTVKEAVQDAEIVFSMLSTPETVSNIFFGENGALSQMKEGAIWTDCTTVNPAFSLQCFTESQKFGIRFIDAPVAGSKPQAENAELAFFIGGEENIVSEILPYTKLMGTKSLHIGNTGKGASYKMIVNMMLAQSMAIFSEAVLLGEAMGIQESLLLDTLPNLAVAAPFTKVKAKNIQNNQYDVQFPLEWMYKDLHLATLTAYEYNQPVHLANAAKELFAGAKKAGLAREDFSAIHKYLGKK